MASVVATLLLSPFACTKACDSSRIPGFLPVEAVPSSPIAAAPAPYSAEAIAKASVKTEEVKVGKGDLLDAAKTLSFHYTGYLADGKKFESSHDSGQPFKFRIGHNEAIPGWEKGVIGMRVGGVRKIVIPPELAYGMEATETIPANSTLTFEIEFLGQQ
jgi:FKBP-type peptidyl-prolyl cis-trans isomerase